MEYPLVSVIISTFNREEKLKRAIKSALSQTYPNIEVIVVGDGKDQLKNITPSWHTGKGNLSLYTIPHFGNDTRPKNYGILQSRGKYIAFCDDDNEFLSDHVMALYREMEKHHASIVYGDRLVIDDKGEPLGTGVVSDFNQGLLFLRNFIDTSDVLVSRDALFDVGGWDERYIKYVDWNLWVRLCKAGYNFSHVSKVLTNYYVSKKSKSGKANDMIIEDSPIGRSVEWTPKWNPFELEIRLPYLNKKPIPKVAVWTLTMNRLFYTKVMHASLLKSGYDFDWVVVDNGSTDGTVEWLKKIKPAGSLKNIHLILNTKNNGISKGSNQAIDYIQSQGYDYNIKVDNDAEILTKDWLDKLLNVFIAHDKMVLSPRVEGLVDNIGGPPRLVYKRIRGHLLGITPHIGGIFVMAHKSAYMGFRWDEEDPLHGMQDMIFTQAMKKKDFICAYVEDMQVTHQETTTGQKERYPEYFENRIYQRTHSIQKEDPNSKDHWNSVYKDEGTDDPNFRNDIESFDKIISKLKEGSILDIGCGNGYFLKYAFSKGWNHLFGIDLSSEGIHTACLRVPMANFLVQKAEKMTFSDKVFDNTVSTQFLEHVENPDEVLKEIARVTKIKTLHIIPYKDDLPSTEHVQEYDEKSITILFEKYFERVHVEVFTHSERKKYTKEETIHSKLLFVEAYAKSV